MHTIEQYQNNMKKRQKLGPAKVFVGCWILDQCVSVVVITIYWMMAQQNRIKQKQNNNNQRTHTYSHSGIRSLYVYI